MKHLLAAWPEVESLIQENAVMLCLDYDGTLTPIVEHPSLAKLSSQSRRVLKDLVRMQDVKVVIISGRLLQELKQFVEVPGIIYVGNHGFEWEGPSISHVHPGAVDSRRLIQKIFKQLEQAFRTFPGIFLENKIFTLSIHYRGVVEENRGLAKRIFLEIMAPYMNASQVILTEGKKVWEVRPEIQWNKGTILLWLFGQVLAHSQKKVLPIYIGDDQTDEDAFKTLKHRGLGIKVNENANEASEATYYLRSPEEVFDFLKQLKDLKGKKIKSYANFGSA